MRTRARGFLALALLIAVGMLVAPFAQTSETEQNKSVVRRHLELMNSGDWKASAEYFAPDVRHHLGNWSTGNERIVQGQKALTDNMEDIFRTFPDWKMEIVEMVAEGDSVVVRCRVSGRHKGVAAKAVNGDFWSAHRRAASASRSSTSTGTRFATERSSIIPRVATIWE